MAKENIMEEKKAKVVKFELLVEEKTFLNDGEPVNYLSFTTKIGDQVINLTPKADDKKLAKYLLVPYLKN